MHTKNYSALVAVAVSLFLALVTSTMAHAQAQQRSTLTRQAPAGPNRPAGVPDGYVITPFGYFHPSCVLRLAEGETLLPDGRVLQHANGILTNIPACKYSHYAASGEIVAAGAAKVESPTINGWVESASVTTSTSYGEIVATWIVPPAPTTTSDGQVVYFFPGMEDSNDVVSIIQPVLGWNMDDTHTPWTIASWNCCPSGITVESSPVTVNPGDAIQGTVRSTCSAGTESCSTWNITTEDVTSGKSTTLSDTPSEGQTFNWAFGGVLEAYDIAACSDYPPNAALTFSNVALYDYNFDLISNPDWSITYWASGEAPQCGYSVLTGSKLVAVDWTAPPSWSTQDLSGLTGDTLAASGSAVAGFSDTVGEHVFYLGTNQHVYQLDWNSTTYSWSNQDLTAFTGGVLAASGSALTSFADSSGEHVYYLGTNRHVYQLYFPLGGTAWVDQDLTAFTGGVLAASGSALTSFADSSGEHVYYRGTNQHVYQLDFPLGGTAWVDQDLTAFTGGALAASGSALTSFADSSGEHVYYLGTNQHVYQLDFPLGGTAWVDQDLTAFTDGALAATGSALAGYSLNSGSVSGEHVVYLGTNQHIYQLYFEEGGTAWVDQDLTALSGGAPAASGSALTYFADTGGAHAFYLGTNQHVYQLYFD
jgi:hypothetical protein